MYVIPLYPQPVFHSNPNIHSSFLCGFLVPSPPSPSDSLTLQSPDTLDRVFPKAQGQAVLPCRHHMAPEQLGSAPPGPRPLVFRRSRSLTLSDTDVFCWYICVFSSNRTNPPSSSLSGNALLDQIYSAALFFFFFFSFFIYCKQCSGNPTWTRRLYFTRKLEGELGIPAWIALFKGSGVKRGLRRHAFEM